MLCTARALPNPKSSTHNRKNIASYPYDKEFRSNEMYFCVKIYKCVVRPSVHPHICMFYMYIQAHLERNSFWAFVRFICRPNISIVPEEMVRSCRIFTIRLVSLYLRRILCIICTYNVGLYVFEFYT